MQPKALGGNVVAEGDRWGASATMALGRWSLQLNRRGAFGLDTVALQSRVLVWAPLLPGDLDRAYPLPAM